MNSGNNLMENNLKSVFVWARRKGNGLSCYFNTISLLVFVVLVTISSESAESSIRSTISLDTGWLYIASDNQSFAATTIDEGSFKSVCVPHANTITKHAYQSETAFRFVSWYRRHFTAPQVWSGKRILIEFEAVSINAVVYVNGTKVGEHRGGYLPFTMDITGSTHIGQDNVVAVQVDSKSQSSVPPEGGSMDYMIFGGIVRHVNLKVVDPLYIDWVFAHIKNPEKSVPASPVVTVTVRVNNTSTDTRDYGIVASIFDGVTKVATATLTKKIQANGTQVCTLTTSALSSPRLWSVDSPNLYTLQTQLVEQNAVVDDFVTRIGVRSLTLDKSDGKCYLNGVPLKLRGLDRHETFPYIGRAASKRLQRKDADILKFDLGCNIIRTSHYPQSPDFLDRCDEIGLLVLEELPGWNYIGNDAWKKLSVQNVKDMVIRDRNHPCILTWGVRINESVDDNTFYKMTNDTAHAYDPTRLTCGVRKSNSDPQTSFLEDIWTQNFVDPNANPDNMPTITTEWCGHNLNPQSHSWDTDEIQIGQITDSKYGHAKGHNDSYKTSIWGGLLGWCAFDYASSHAMATTNETGRGKNSYVCPHGVASIFRLPKLAGWFYQSQRDPALYGPMVHICNFWTAESPTTILVVSNCPQVELFKDGKSLEKKTSGNLYTSLPHPCFSWTTTFSPGELKAVGYINGTEAVTHSVRTPGSPKAVTVIPDTTTLFTGGDMTRVVVSLVDSFGQVLHLRADSVTMSASGAGEFIGEEKSALEGGQFAFYVRTGSSGSGVITCQASAAGISGNATVSVVDGGAVDIQPIVVSHVPFVKSEKVFKNVFVNSENILSNRNSEDFVKSYDLKGQLLFNGTVKNYKHYLQGKKAASCSIRIIKIEPSGRASTE
jgi:beta-galactosidase